MKVHLRHQRLFTLLELAAVCFLIVLIVGTAVPQLSRFVPRMEEENDVRRLAKLLTMIHNESVSTGVPYQMQYDLDNNRYWVNLVAQKETEVEASPRSFETRFGKLIFREIHFGEGKVLTSESLVIDVRPEGYIEPHRIYLENEDRSRVYTLVANPITGIVNIYHYEYVPEG